MAVTFDASSLLSYYQARTGLSGLTAGGSNAASASRTQKYAPTPPWSPSSGATRASDLVRNALAGRRFVDENAAQLDLPGASGDYRKLFALYQGLNTLYGLTERATATGVSAPERSRIASIFARGLGEVAAYADKLELETLRLTRGEAMLSDKTAVGVPRAKYEYRTATLHSGAQSDAVAAFQGAVQFTISVTRGGTTTPVAIDLAEMGSTDRTMGAVAAHINGKLEAAGFNTRFAVERTPGQPRKVTSGGTTVTLPALADDYRFRVAGDSVEQVSFSAADVRPAVYVTTRAGDPDPDGKTETADGVFETTLTKLDGSAVGAAGSRISANGLEATVQAVRASKVGPDGALYLLADVKATVGGQAVKGEQDVALLKYDSAGRLVFARTLGATADASGMALDIAADGRVAIAGKVSGALGGATAGPLNSDAASARTDSFVTVFDAKGDEVWSLRRGALLDDEATHVAFGEGGLVYVGGRTKSSLPGASATGDWDAYLMAVAPDAKGTPRALYTSQFGTTGADSVGGLAVSGGAVTVAAVENGRAVLRSFQATPTETTVVRRDQNGVTTITTTHVTNGASTQTVDTYGAPDGSGGDTTTTTVYTSAVTLAAGATRDLGDLQGGSIGALTVDGGRLWIAGATRNGALSVGGVTRAYNAGIDAFAAAISTDLSNSSADNLAYFGGSGDDSVAGVAVSGGKVWVAGRAAADQPGATAIAAEDGYLAGLDVTAGTVAVQRLTGKDGVAAASSVAIDATGASALDKLGLPKGSLLYADSVKLVSATAVRAGDSFQIRTAEGGRLGTVTIAADDTLESLAGKIRRAAGFRAKVELVSDGDLRRLKITPATDTSTVEILPGKGGVDALEGLGLAAGVVRNTVLDRNGKSVSADGGGPAVGLGLPAELSVVDETGAKAALSAISKALGRIREGYRQLEAAAKPQTTAAGSAAAAGPAPAYLTNQIANYQAALNRLNGGG